MFMILESKVLYLQRYKNPIDKALKPVWTQAPKSEPALELISRAVPSVEAHQGSLGPDAGRNSGGKQIIKKLNTRQDKG